MEKIFLLKFIDLEMSRDSSTEAARSEENLGNDLTLDWWYVCNKAQNFSAPLYEYVRFRFD